MSTNVTQIKEELKKFLDEKLELLTKIKAKEVSEKFCKGSFVDLPVFYLQEIQKETNFFQLCSDGFCYLNTEKPDEYGKIIDLFGFKANYKGIPFTFVVEMSHYASDCEIDFNNAFLIEIKTLEEKMSEFYKKLEENPLRACFALDFA